MQVADDICGAFFYTTCAKAHHTCGREGSREASIDANGLVNLSGHRLWRR
jgi:hypothetical protein